MPVFFHTAARDFAPYAPQDLTAVSVKDLLENLSSYLTRIPEEDRWDFYYTLAATKAPRKSEKRCKEEGLTYKDFQDGNFISQEVFALDIDREKMRDASGKIVKDEKGEAVRVPLSTNLEAYQDIVAQVLHVRPEDMTIVQSGHGLHFLLWLTTPITSWKYFRENKTFYAALCERLNSQLRSANLPGELDSSVWDHGRVFRLPGTENRKGEPPYPRAKLFQLSFTPYTLTWSDLLDLPPPDASPGLAAEEWRRLKATTLDIEGIEKGCGFLAWSKDRGPELKEPEIYKALQCLTFMDPTFKLAREYASRFTGSTSFGSADQSAKLEHAYTATGKPATCDSIAQLQPEICGKCSFRGVVKTPLSIKRDNFIPTEATGFHTVSIGPDGKMSRRPSYSDLYQAFTRDTHGFYHPVSRQVWGWNGTHYEPWSEARVKHFAETHFKPLPTETMRSEFLAKVKANQLKNGPEYESFFTATTRGKLNLKNGVLDCATKELEPHAAHYGFRYVLPYAYDPTALCPRFERFLDEVTLSREPFQKVLRDMLGALFVSGYQEMKAGFWWLQGSGRNGKSTLLDIAKALVGLPQTTYFKTEDFIGGQARFRLADLDGRLLCILEEVGAKTFPMALMSMIKDLSAGGTVKVERKGKDPFEMTNSAKLIFTANKQPVLEDTTDAVRARFIIVPFGLKLDDPSCHVKMDGNLARDLLAELPGIFNLALAARDELVARGRPYKPQEVEDAYSQLERDSDSVKDWFAACAERAVSIDALVALPDAYSQYLAYVENENPVSRKTFGTRVREILGMEEACYMARVPGHDIPVRVFRNMKLRADAPVPASSF